MRIVLYAMASYAVYNMYVGVVLISVDVVSPYTQSKH